MWAHLGRCTDTNLKSGWVYVVDNKVFLGPRPGSLGVVVSDIFRARSDAVHSLCGPSDAPLLPPNFVVTLSSRGPDLGKLRRRMPFWGLGQKKLSKRRNMFVVAPITSRWCVVELSLLGASAAHPYQSNTWKE